MLAKKRMEELEKKLLLEIKGLLSELEREPTKTCQLIGKQVYKDSPSGDMYCVNAQLILGKIVQLKNECKPDYIDDALISTLRWTFDNKVSCVKNATIKPKATNKWRSKLKSYMYDATQYLKRDIYNVIDKINKLK
ncbi:hypothetical protein AGMMS4957_01130 [Bacteroidia bacterium]|nr:hypothetical protein AGMMS4957_01130 [Bacteroidia bacterium]